MPVIISLCLMKIQDPKRRSCKLPPHRLGHPGWIHDTRNIYNLYMINIFY